ncbi:MAG: peptide deformylase [Clostridiales bacterium]|jgi:peptide deformylase|nr:peptide deformylase [Clostridiales bacterium]
MGLRTVRKEGDEILKKKCKIVNEINPAIIELLDDMRQTLTQLDAVGIAAPQIGTLKRIVVIDFEDELYELINPEIIEEEGEQVCNEACLSIPGRCGDVTRPREITVKALNREGEEKTIEADDFLTSIMCHEIDHLDGVLFIDKATNIQMINEEQMRARKRARKKRIAERKLKKQGVYTGTRRR